MISKQALTFMCRLHCLLFITAHKANPGAELAPPRSPILENLPGSSAEGTDWVAGGKSSIQTQARLPLSIGSAAKYPQAGVTTGIFQSYSNLGNSLQATVNSQVRSSIKIQQIPCSGSASIPLGNQDTN